MTRSRTRAALWPPIMGLMLLAGIARSQSLEVIHTFSGGSDGPRCRLVQAADGTLYGTTVLGGVHGNGSVFKMQPDGAGGFTFSRIHSLSHSEGQSLIAGLILAGDGNFYGTASSGGIDDNGTVFRVDSSGNLTTLHSFTSSEGAHPYAALVQAADGAFYGTTVDGGDFNRGTVFKMSAAGSVTVLHSFAGPDGANPYASLLQASDGFFYGTTHGGGDQDVGTVFRMDGTGALTTLHSFSLTDGAQPFSELIQASDGNFYGTTYWGGPGNTAMVFRMDAAGNVTVLHSFTETEKGNPQAGLVQAADGSLYGTTNYNNGGSVFKIDLAGNLTVLHTFSSTEGLNPYGTLIQGADGRLFGTTSWAGAEVGGSVFAVDPAGGFSTLHSFASDAGRPFGALMQASDGKLYGGASIGGAGDGGALFRADLTGEVTIAHSFVSASGRFPNGSLIQATDGSLYGMTEGGGQNGYGTAFRMDLPGDFTVLHSFGDPPGLLDGIYPQAGLVQAADGNFYGTTNYEGSDGNGTVFKMDGAGNVTVLHSFSRSEGVSEVTLAAAPDGRLYGTTTNYGEGAVYRVDPSGSFSILHSFTASDGIFPLVPLITATDGNIYGVTFGDWANNRGTVFRIDPSGSLTTLHVFTGSDGSGPGLLIQGRDGNFFGTTYGGGANNSGTIYKMDFAGNVTTLYSFAVNDFSSLSTLVQASDGNLYGMTPEGGVGQGTIVRLNLPPPTSTSLSSSSNPSFLDQPVSFTATVTSTSGAPTGTVTFEDGSTVLDTVALSGNTAVLTTSALSAGSHAIAAVYSGDSSLSGGISPVLVQTVTTPCDSPTAVVSGNTSICAGGSATIQAALTGQAPWNVTWSDGVTQTGLTSSPATRSVSPSSTTNYTVTVISDAQCSGASSGSATVTVNPLPIATASGTATICAGNSTSLTGSGGTSCSWTPATGLSSATSCSPVASPSLTTTYTLTVTDANGCVSTNNAAVTVTVKTRPTAAVSGSASVCAGSSATVQAALTGTAPWTVTWSDGVTQSGVGASPATRSVSPSATTSYTITAVSDADCSGTFSGSATITVKPLPTAVASGSATIGAGSSTPLSGSGGISCSWSPAAGLSSATSCSPTASPAVTTTYTLTVTDAAGCSSTNAPTVTVTVGAAKPDLVVSVLTAPAAAVPGSAVPVTDSTKNQGSGFAAASMTKFYLSVNSTYESGDTYLGSRSVPNLAPGTTSAAATTLTIPSGTATGNYYVLARADADGTSAESNESNNVKASAIRVSPPDLVVSVVSAPAASGAGLTIAVADTTKNQTGAGPAAGSTTRFYLSPNNLLDAGDQPLGERAVPALAPGTASSGSTSLTIPAGTAAGSYFILAKADADNANSETDETNNVSFDAIVIGPDLVVTALTAPATGTVGGAISVTDTTKNQGGGSATGTATRFYLSTDAIFGSGDTPLTASRSVPALGPGASSSGSTSVTIPATTPAGSYYLIAVADGGAAVGETDESNNTRASAIVIRPDLVVSALTVPAAGGAGFPVTVTDTTKNQGGAGASASTTTFYLSSNSTFGAGDILLGSRPVSALGIGGSSSSPTTLTIPAGTAAGTYYIVAVADSAGAVIETDETNNSRSAVIKVSPDLIVSVLTGPSTATAGATISVSDTTKNQGISPAMSTKTKLYFSVNTTLDAADPLLGSRSVPSLAAGASSSGTTSVTIPAGTAPGTYSILAVADADSEVSETGETNNLKTLAITITN